MRDTAHSYSNTEGQLVPGKTNGDAAVYREEIVSCCSRRQWSLERQDLFEPGIFLHSGHTLVRACAFAGTLQTTVFALAIN